MAKSNGNKNLAAVMLGQLAALKMTKAERKQRAQTAARARWGPSKKGRAKQVAG